MMGESAIWILWSGCIISIVKYVRYWSVHQSDLGIVHNPVTIMWEYGDGNHKSDNSDNAQLCL